MHISHSGSNYVRLGARLSLRSLCSLRFGALEKIRTSDIRFRRPDFGANPGEIQRNDEPVEDGTDPDFPEFPRTWANGMAETQIRHFEAIAADTALRAWLTSYAESLAYALAPEHESFSHQL